MKPLMCRACKLNIKIEINEQPELIMTIDYHIQKNDFSS